MSDYTKSTNFASKDNLASGNPLKIVKGAEIDTEFNNIAIAIATKLDTNAAGTIAVQNANNVTITGGSITNITDLTVADGGTGASTAENARTNLGAAKSGANSDITSLTGLTTPLSAAQGGTGSTTYAYAGGRGQVFTSTGTFTVPAGVSAVKVTVVGGGGSGGSVSSSTQGPAGGGGAGGTAIKFLTSLTAGNTIAVTISGAGASSSISSGTQTITTVSASAGSAGSYGVGGAGGIGSNGDINIRGGAGGTGAYLGGNAGYSYAGGNGGSSTLGGGGTGGLNAAAGGAGGVYGGGGGGAAQNNDTGYSGGSGGSGVVIFEW